MFQNIYAYNNNQPKKGHLFDREQLEAYGRIWREMKGKEEIK